MRDDVSSSLGFVCMIGGVLFPTFQLVMNGLLESNTSGVVAAIADTVLVLTFLFLLAGGIGLYLAQRDAFGRIGTAAAIVLVLGLSLTVVEGAVTAIELNVSFDDELNAAATGLLTIGMIASGIVTAWVDELLHGRIGGALLALSLSLTLAGNLVFEALGVDSVIASAFLVGVPFGLPWIILGLDLLTVPDQEDLPRNVDVS